MSFVCGAEKAEFNKVGINFDKFIEEDHNPWHYIYYIYYMMEKGEDDLTGLEYHAWSKYLEKSTDWLPISDTLYLGKKTQKRAKINKFLEEEDEEEQIVKISKSLRSMKRKMKSMSHESKMNFVFMRTMLKEVYKKMRDDKYQLRRISSVSKPLL